MLNVHPSLVPRWRGAAPIERALMAGDRDDRRHDHAGHRRARLGPDRACRGGRRSPSRRLRVALGEARRARRRAGGPRPRPPGGGRARVHRAGRVQATYAEKISPEERHLRPSRPAAELERRCGRSDPHIGAHLELEDGEPPGRARARTAVPEGRAAIEERWTGGLVLGSAEAALELDVVQPPGEKPMSAADFLRGPRPMPARSGVAASASIPSSHGRTPRQRLGRRAGSPGGDRGRPAAPQLPRAAASPGCAPPSFRAGSSASTACAASSWSPSAPTAASTGRSAA